MLKKFFPLNIICDVYSVIETFMKCFFEDLSPDKNILSSFKLTLYLLFSQLIMILGFGFCSAETIRYINDEMFPLMLIWQLFWGFYVIYLLMEYEFSIQMNQISKFHIYMGKILFLVFVLSVTVLPISALTFGLLKIIIKVAFLLLFFAVVAAFFCITCIDVQPIETK